jgi:hypothetical protein
MFGTSIRTLAAFCGSGIAALGVLIPAPALASPPCDEACTLAAAQSYLDALVSHNAQQVPFADNVQRVENGKVTGSGAESMRADLENGLRFKVIFNLRDEQIMVDGDEVFAVYSLDTGKLGNTGRQLATARVFERFRVVDGLITEIEASFHIQAGHVPPPVWPDQQAQN